MHQTQDEECHTCHSQTNQRGVVVCQARAAVPEHAFGGEEPKGRQTEQGEQADDQGKAVER